jgi:hypothetical protein
MNYLTFNPKLNVLPMAQQNLWPKLKNSVELGFVLYGGTAIALKLGHRLSIDFDFFSDKSLDKEQIIKGLPFLKDAQTIQDQKNSWTVLWKDEKEAPVKVSFFGGIDFGRIGQPSLTKDRVLLVADLKDLMANKLKVILQRAELKDYQDIAAMLRADYSLSDGLMDARQLFGQNFQPSEALKALCYFNDGDLKLISNTDKKTILEAVEAVPMLFKEQTSKPSIFIKEASLNQLSNIESLKNKSKTVDIGR